MARQRQHTTHHAHCDCHRWTVTIPNWHPARLNQLIGNRFKAARLKKADRELILHYLRNVPSAEGKRRVSVTIVLGKGQRGGDPDCYNKSLLDSLVYWKKLVDDNRQGVELAPLRFERADKPATILELEDMEEP